MGQQLPPSKPRCYRRPMPRSYIVRWAALITLSTAFQMTLFVAADGFSPKSAFLFLLAIPFAWVSGYFGAFLWGRIFWSLWLHRLYPPIEGFKSYWWYPDRS